MATSNNPRVIALTGLAGSGKSTAAKTLLAQGDHWVLIKFADPLKDMLRQLYRGMCLSSDEIERRIEGDLKEQPCDYLNGASPRRAMQTLGTEWGRESLSPDFWTNLWSIRAEAALAMGKNVVVDDCRFANEAAAVNSIRDYPALIISIEGRESSDSSGHISEAGGVVCDELVLNDGSIDDLRDKLFDLV